MDYIKNMDEDLCVYTPAIPAWVLREESKYFQRRLHDLRNLGTEVYF